VALLALLVLVSAGTLEDHAWAQRRGGSRQSRGTTRGVKGQQPAPKGTGPAGAAAPEDSGAGGQAKTKSEEERDLKRGERVEFDGRLIEGQTAASGAIYLFERLPSELRSMVRERQSYRREVLETVYENGVPPPAATGERPAQGAAERPGAR
jgi:hypothetical protein